MRSARIKGLQDESAVYHCVTRTVNGEFLFDDRAKEVFRKQLWQAASFSGVTILTYCILSNHFHVLVRVPERQQMADQELIRRYRILYPKVCSFTRLRIGAALMAKPDESVETILASGGADAEKLRASLHRRMGDVSEFMKTVKQRFSVWFNRTHQRYGTLWSERFKSVLVEACPRALATVAAYIDLNPVRAGLVRDPKDYRFCGYAEAVGEANKGIRAGLCALMESENWNEVLRDYRMVIFGKGSEAKFDGSEAGSIPSAAATQVLNAGGRLPLTTVLRCRVRYFTDGAVLGSQAFVADALKRYQEMTGRRRRQVRPEPLPGADWAGLSALRRLRQVPFG
jgi:putative transposase